MILWYSIKVQNLERTYTTYHFMQLNIWGKLSQSASSSTALSSTFDRFFRDTHSTFILDASWILSALDYTKMLKVDVVASTWRLARFVSKWTQFHVSIFQVVLTNLLMTYFFPVESWIYCTYLYFRYLVSKIFEIEIWVLQVTFKYSTYANSLLVSSDKKDKE